MLLFREVSFSKLKCSILLKRDITNLEYLHGFYVLKKVFS